ncbi:MAG: DmpA family aminopeptidase [Candidatus Xenobia bacterium]
MSIGSLRPGPCNAITDIAGVTVGHTTLIEGDGPLRPGEGPVRTGVTAILPHPDPWMQRLPASAFILNGNGEMTGFAVLRDLGYLDQPILLTNTLNVGRVLDAAVAWLLDRHPEAGVSDDIPLPVVAECDDSHLNDIRGRHVHEAHVRAALDSARAGKVEQGAVGAGTGMMCYGYKGGIGTSSRRVEYTVGVLVNANHGRRHELTIEGAAAGRMLAEHEPLRRTEGSIIIVLATDAPLLPHQLHRLAKRAALGLARTGAQAHHGSGDLVLAFSTRNAVPRQAEEKPYGMESLADGALNPVYQAAIEATEEAVLNSIFCASTLVGRDGNTAEALPTDAVLRLLRR